MNPATQICPGPTFLEGPVWCVPDVGAPSGAAGTLVVTDVGVGALHRVDLATGEVTTFADTAGGANGAAPTAAGGFLVTQNGGLDFAAIGLFDDPPEIRPARPGIQHVTAEGVVTYLTPEPLQAPNDLVVAADGTVYFTDPPAYPLPVDARGRIMALRPDGTLAIVADGLFYPNGIGIDADGLLVVVENGLQSGRADFGLVRLHPDGHRERFTDRTGDGFCFDQAGRIYLAGGIHGVTVFEPDGTVVEVLELPGSGITTNCCFGGPDGRTLFATEAFPGGVWAWTDMPTAGVGLTPWPGRG